jgi:dihydropteroate synthase
MKPLVRIIDASLGADNQVSLVVSGVDDLDLLRSTWASSGATVERVGDRLHATTTVVALARAAGRCLDRTRAEQLRIAAEAAVAAWLDPAPAARLGADVVRFGPAAAVMGIVNVTPDSFSDGGVLYPTDHPRRAVEQALAMQADGAVIVDVGGESSRPGARSVAVDEELRRALPVVEALADRDVLVSIDTVKAEVAQAAVAAGARIVNDVSGARYPELLDVVAAGEVAYVLMHTRATPADMQRHAHYDDVVAETYEFLADGLERLATAGVARERVIVDPGIGFAKDLGHNLALLRHLRQLTGLGRPVLVGASRKTFIGTLTGGQPDDRLEGSLAAAVLAVTAGACIVRVHDVAATRRALDVAAAISHPELATAPPG